MNHTISLELHLFGHLVLDKMNSDNQQIVYWYVSFEQATGTDEWDRKIGGMGYEVLCDWQRVF